MKHPQELSRAELIDVVCRVQQALWPRGDSEHQWSPDTLDGISLAMVDANTGPERKREG